jgi:hypothetical protein
MNRHGRLLTLTILVAATAAACGSSASSAGNSGTLVPSASPTTSGGSSTQRSEGGQVTVEATWAGLSVGASFDVKLDTHSVDLDALDLSNAILRNNRGEALAAVPWTAPKGGHHREGTLAFADNVAAFLAGATSFDLVLTGVGDLPQRTLHWQIGS